MIHVPRSEGARKLAHMAAGGGAILLRYLAWWEALVLVALALAFNLYALPRLAGGSLMRARETARQFNSGVVLYPLSLLFLIVLLPERMDIVAAAWGILAVGDGMATLAGRRFGSRPLPWNREKSVEGSLAFFICGGAAGALLCWWCRPAIIPPPYSWFSIGIPVLAAAVAALVETLPIRLDDNVSIPLTAAAVMWPASLVSQDLARAAWSAMLPLLPLAAAVNIAVAGAGYAARTISLSGAVCGALIGMAILLTVGWGGWGLLLLTFAAAVVTSRVGLQRKVLLGIAEAREGRRGPANAIANTGVATVAALLAVLIYAPEPALVAFAAALTAGGSDTISSEVGKAFGRRTFLVTTLREVRAGTPGGLSIEGTAAGLIGAFALAAFAIAVHVIPASALLPVVAGATAGSLAESALGATLEPAGILNNDVLNLLNTAIAAWIAVTLYSS
jgi:uncharacterized protein (TIGR00297 family)